MLAEHRAAIMPLSSAYSRQLWSRLVSSTYRHLMRIPHHEFPFPLIADAPVTPYTADWDAGKAERIQAVLQSALRWAPETTVYFFWMAEQAIETTWSTFLQNWPIFLFEDEAAILLSEAMPEVVLFSTGYMRFGQRT